MGEVKVVEVDWAHDSNAEESHGIQKGSRCDSDECYIETKALCQDPCQGGKEGLQDESRDIKCNWEHENSSGGSDGKWGWADGAASNAHHRLFTLRTKVLTAGDFNQHGWHDCMTVHTPRPPTLLGTHHRCPTHQPDLLC